jgi:hypothetical protein
MFPNNQKRDYVKCSCKKIKINEKLWKNLQFKASYALLAVQIFSLSPIGIESFAFIL